MNTDISLSLFINDEMYYSQSYKPSYTGTVAFIVINIEKSMTGCFFNKDNGYFSGMTYKTM